MFYDCDSDHDLDKLDPETLESYIQELENPETGTLRSNSFTPQDSLETAHDENPSRASQGPVDPAHNRSNSADRPTDPGTARKGSAFRGPKADMFRARSQLNIKSRGGPSTSDAHDRQLSIARSLRPVLNDDSDSNELDSDKQQLSPSPPEDISDSERTTQPLLDQLSLSRKNRSFLPFSTPMNSEILSKRRCQICLTTNGVSGGIKTNYILCKKCQLFLKRVVDYPRQNGYKCITDGNCSTEKKFGDKPCSLCRIKKAVHTGLILPENHPYFTHNHNMDDGSPEESVVSQESCAPPSEKDAVDATTEVDNVVEMGSEDSDTIIDGNRASRDASKSPASTVLDEPIFPSSHMPSSVVMDDHSEDCGSAEYFINGMMFNRQDLLVQQAILDSYRKKKLEESSGSVLSRYRPEVVELSKELDEYGLPKNVQDLYNKWFYGDCSQTIGPRSLPHKNIEDETTLEEPCKENIIVCNQFDISDPDFALLTEKLSEADPSDEITSLHIEILASEELEMEEMNYKNSLNAQQAPNSIDPQMASDKGPQLSIEMRVNRTIIDRRPATLRIMRNSQTLQNNQSQTSHSSESVIAPGEDCDDSDDDCDPIEVG